jgi:hypothetical protein
MLKYPWARMITSRVYHLRVGGWVRSGKAACGANLDRPAFEAKPNRSGLRYCKHCEAKAEASNERNRSTSRQAGQALDKARPFID